MGNLIIKRIYEQPSEDDGYRVLIDRLWPRGVSKQNAKLSEWNKDIAPSPDLRVWFGHKEENFEEFKNRYVSELSANPSASAFRDKCQRMLSEGNVTLLYGAKSPTCNHAVILRDWILRDG